MMTIHLRPLLIVLLAIFGIYRVVQEARINVEYNRFAASYWELSVKASTLQQKSIYLDQYVEAIDDATKFADNNAIVFPTPDNSYIQNLVALKSLQSRMHQIQGMDETTFAYQTAMQQITAQEQDQAADLTDTFVGCWYLHNHPTYWSWIDGLLSVSVILSIIGLLISLGT